MIKGTKHTEEARKKIKDNHSHNKSFLGRVHSTATKEKISLKIQQAYREGRIRKDLEHNHNWVNGRSRTSTGYIIIKSPKHPYAIKTGYVAEHRLVMEKHLGRFLNPKEVVHHLNGKRDDNRIENLQLFSTKKEHMNNHNKQMFLDMLRKAETKILIEEIEKRGYKITQEE